MREVKTLSARHSHTRRSSAGVTAVHAAPFVIDPTLSGEQLLQMAGLACLDHLSSNRDAALSGDAEGIHQMRVAVRRLRAILSAFARFLPSEPRRRASNELKWLTDALGEARNLDVFASELLQPARSALPAASEFERLARAIERRRSMAHAAARAAVASPGLVTSVEKVRKWLIQCEWCNGGDAGALQQRVDTLAPIMLERFRQQANKRSKHFASQTAEQRHELRIALKKLRYTVEMLASLYEPGTAKRFIQLLKRLQDDLGAVNDWQVGQDIVAALAGHGASKVGIGHAGRRILAWHRSRLAANEPKLRRHLQQLLSTQSFWPSAQ